MDGWFNCHRKVNRVEKICLTKGQKSPIVISYISVASAVNGQLRGVYTTYTNTSHVFTFCPNHVKTLVQYQLALEYMSSPSILKRIVFLDLWFSV